MNFQNLSLLWEERRWTAKMKLDPTFSVVCMLNLETILTSNYKTFRSRTITILLSYRKMNLKWYTHTEEVAMCPNKHWYWKFFENIDAVISKCSIYFAPWKVQEYLQIDDARNWNSISFHIYPRGLCFSEFWHF